ncbi:NADH-quinone oxidoreductase subunit NuoH [Fodinibius saliphilus]|uniref:NADH-quinone oxidoreductase subunit NuoH n=1 Tax=Fodinibius saliphilus TaxID=1920650 RepID=UPI0011084731|nr:NADH-quinone oxidoreductase subunit NuoH [Fodinibius saliphilus]
MLSLLEQIIPSSTVALIIFATLPLALIAVYALFAIWLERKVSAHIQDRLGPMRVGGWHGWAQTIADMLKLIQKEDIIPTNASRFLFKMAPFVLFAASYAAFSVIPFSSAYIGSSINIGVFYLLAVTSLLTLSVLMGSWASNNKWSLLGGMRTAAQMVSYEVPTIMSVLSVLVVAGSLNLMTVTEMQAGNDVMGFLPNWLIFQNPFLLVAFVIFFISIVAESHRVPFDLPESESELVAGFQTEYSGMRWGIFMLAEYADMLLLSLLGAVLFFGGWASPFGEFLSGPIWGFIWIMLKGMLFVFVMMWMRWTLPRYRVDQLMEICWSFLIPISFVNFVLIALWEMIF